VILSASGMCEAGRIRHHLKHNLWRPQNLILFVGYQAEGTLGRNLIEGIQDVRLFGEDIAVRAEIKSLKGTSGHADQQGLIRWLESFDHKPKTVFLNHGNEESISVMADELKERGYAVEAPYSGTEYDLLTGRMTVYTDGVSVKKTPKADSRANQVYTELVAAAEALLQLVRGRKGRTNKDNSRLTSQIRSLIDKWKD
jgi:metallo-beta-lactamase family protein